MKAWTYVENVGLFGRGYMTYGVIFAETYEEALAIAEKESNGEFKLCEIPIETGYHFIG